ncbi:transmembrane protein, putative [Medicago truncatula]|uniref:Transmembrane protein, putative n=1 Tax=Medicago truncatula TaxID=3880 RepID=A0A072UHP6_MEDTR|nr:transmembrane protein, putative [Medicago truncatula]
MTNKSFNINIRDILTPNTLNWIIILLSNEFHLALLLLTTSPLMIKLLTSSLRKCKGYSHAFSGQALASSLASFEGRYQKYPMLGSPNIVFSKFLLDL